jgi:hypothetical protein
VTLEIPHAPPKKNRSWTPIVAAVVERIKQLREREMRPSLRRIHYYLFTNKIGGYRNNVSDYGELSKHLVQARLNHWLKWDDLSDGIRETINIPEPFEPWERYLARGTSHLQNGYENYTIPRGMLQKNYVEVWIEKQTEIENAYVLLKDRQVTIVANHGNDSWTHLYESMRRIEQQYKQGKQIHIFYLGDYDPSGLNMDKELWDRIRYFCQEIYMDQRRIHFERLAVTKEQIERLSLPKNPILKKPGKKKEDPNLPAFRAANNGEAFAVELDVLTGGYEEEFDSLLVGAVDNLFDEETYEKVKEEETIARKRISRYVGKLRLTPTPKEPDITEFIGMCERQ